ncbi:MAG: cobalt-precorrin-5B (C(1))-methyltransferase, partial [Deltaproteobacteria bacterium]|nr:cobalt-precorrin-5B (C(1))-methyltransferase [Deltaproteobacteria bacterium]
ADVTISVSRGKELAKKTLNPRLGITGGISILGSTGIVIPYSHEAYRESIACALDVAQASGITTIVFSTGKSSEKIARKVYNHLPEEAFVLMADHFAHALQSAQERGFTRISICCFPAKLLKMAGGLENTHCTRASIDLELLSELAVRSGISNKTARALAQANTVRHAVEMLQAGDAIRLCAHMARIASEFINTLTRHPVEKEILVLGYDNTVLYHSK